jgi:hypothetical protein
MSNDFAENHLISYCDGGDDDLFERLRRLVLPMSQLLHSRFDYENAFDI